MTQEEFDMLLNKAASGDKDSMFQLASLCKIFFDGAIEHNDPASAQMYMGLFDGWVNLAQSGFTDFGDELNQVKEFTRQAFSGVFQ